MTIDEAIEKYKEITNTDTICPSHCNISCDKCVQQSEQLVEWLEELKVYQQHEIICNKGYNAGYNKAIDDFKKELVKNSERARPGGWLSEIVTCKKIYEIAEQLKTGGENDKSI